MTFENDLMIKAQNDYEFWDTWVKFMGLFKDKPLPDLQRHVYVVGLCLKQDEPFCGQAMHQLIKELNVIPYQNNVYEIDAPTFATYKNKIKNKGWLNKDGTLLKSIADVRKVYQEESLKGVKSISLLFKLCVC